VFCMTYAIDTWNCEARQRLLQKEDEWVNSQVDQVLKEFDQQINALFQPFTATVILGGTDDSGEVSYFSARIKIFTWQDATSDWALSSSLSVNDVMAIDVPINNASMKSYEDALDIGMAVLPLRWHYFTRGGNSSRKVLVPSPELQIKWTGEVFTQSWQIALTGSFEMPPLKELSDGIELIDLAS
jgi:hypothetical protein